MSTTSTSSELKPFITTISYKQASLGVLLAIAFGYGIFIGKFYLDPIIISMFNWSMLNFFSNLYLIQVTLPSHLFYLDMGFKFLTDTPACFGWFFGGIIVGSYYKRKNAHFNGVKGSWKSFSISIMAIELIFIGGALYYLISYLVSTLLGVNFMSINFMSITQFFGGLILFSLTFFITPGFWLSISFVLLGGVLGSKATRPAEVPTPPKKAPKIVREVKPAVAKPVVKKPVPAVAKPMVTKPAPAVAKPIVAKPAPSVAKPAPISVKVPPKPPIVSKVGPTPDDARFTEEVLRTKKCPKCKKPFQDQRIKLIESGKDTFCPGCLKVVKGKVAGPAVTPTISTEIQKKRDEVKEIIKVGQELLDKNEEEKAMAFFEDAILLAKEMNAQDLLDEIERILRGG
ncbi:MAG: hypothetical protein HWN67_04280 [Candidatus Helarchaeota archaeon]|nr:hypothetical protein [Candidatus Helarchaeota archaeon]